MIDLKDYIISLLYSVFISKVNLFSYNFECRYVYIEYIKYIQITENMIVYANIIGNMFTDCVSNNSGISSKFRSKNRFAFLLFLSSLKGYRQITVKTDKYLYFQDVLPC